MGRVVEGSERQVLPGAKRGISPQSPACALGNNPWMCPLKTWVLWPQGLISWS